MILRRLFDVSWKIKNALNIGIEAELKKNIKVIDDFVYKLIQTKIEQIHNAEDEFLVKVEVFETINNLKTLTINY